MKIYTIGHSTRSIKDFIDILLYYNIKTLVDVRSIPGSRYCPQFNKEDLCKSLKEYDISYKHISKLGGRRKVLKESKHTEWTNISFRAYADYMDTAEFEEGFNELKTLAINENVAYMCSEAVWWKCHRRMISDKLKSENWEVIHIFDKKQTQIH